MNDFFVNNITNRLVDWYTGRYTIKAYHELMDTQWMSAQEIVNYQDEKLERLIHHAYNNVQYYRDLFDSNKLNPSDIKTVDDLKKLPVSTKKSFKEHPNYPNSMLASNLSLKHVNVGYTGGTTGNPLKLYSDVHNRSYAWAAYWRWYTWMGMEPSEKTVNLWGLHAQKSPYYKELLHKVIEAMSNNRRIDAYNLKEGDIAGIVRMINQYKPSHIHGFASSLSYLARKLSKMSSDIVPLKAVSTTVDVLEPNQRMLLERVFGCPVFNQYGCGECNSIAFECSAHTGLHIASEHCHVEFLRDDEGLPSKAGKVVITNLDNLIMPIIRYENGDYGEPSESVCECGRQLPLIKKIGGRTIDIIRTKSGVYLHGEYFTDLLKDIGWYDKYDIGEYQFVQEDIDKFRWYIVLKKGPQPTKEDMLEITRILEDKLESSDIQIIFVDEIAPESSGKFRYIKSMVSGSLP